MDTVRVRFEPQGAVADVRPGATLHEAAAEAGVELEAPCGGLGRCGSCRVKATGGVRGPTGTELEALSPADLASGFRLGCMARADGPADAVVTVAPARSLRIETGAPAPSRGIEPRVGLGVAVDLGTTTVVVAVHDLADGRRLDTAMALNPQVAFGHDVLSRVSRSIAGDSDALRAAVTAQLARLLRRMAPADESVETVVVGNTAMVHLLLGRDAAPLAAAPHDGAIVEPLTLPALDVGIPGAPDATVFVGPAVSAFVGADAVAGALAVGLVEREDPTLLVDLGTNGELLLHANGATLATSAAAGPAMEGVSISSGMRAEPGAIERVRFDGTGLDIATVDGEPARGVCGSGLLDSVAALLESGVIDSSGRMHAHGPLAARVSTTDEGERFELAPGVFLTQQDVRALQLAKAAVAVAIEVLLEEAALPAGAVREVVVAGGFGSHLSPASLVRLGVLPPGWEERVTFAGNTALDGAVAMLLEPAARDRALDIARGTCTVALAGRPDFQSRFLAALDFPDRTP